MNNINNEPFNDDLTCLWRGIEIEITAEVPKDDYDYATSWSTRERIVDVDAFSTAFPGITADDDGAAEMIAKHWRVFHDDMHDEFSWAEDCAKQDLKDAYDYQNFLDAHAPRMEDMR